MPDYPPDQIYCPNCQNELRGQYCYHCGQNQKGIDRFFWSIFNEVFDNIFSRRSRSFLTLFYLLVRPGFLVVEYFSGRRARYVQPLKLYILTSLLFFTLLSISNFFTQPDDFSPAVVTDSQGIIHITDKNKEKSQIDEAMLDLNFGFLSEENNDLLREKIRAQLTVFAENTAASSKSFISAFIESAPLGLFLLVPVFALILKLFYLPSGLYYTQHLILAVYNHSFLFLVLSINIVLGFFDGLFLAATQALTKIFEFWTVIYIFLSLKFVYKQSIFITLVKFSLLAFLYFCLFIIIFVSFFLWNFLFL